MSLFNFIRLINLKKDAQDVFDKLFLHLHSKSQLFFEKLIVLLWQIDGFMFPIILFD